MFAAFSSSGEFTSSKLKPQLKMAVSRFQILSNKKTALMKQTTREIAKLLAADSKPKEKKAMIRTEALIREEMTIEAYDLLSPQCELLHERVRLIESMDECPEELVSSISTLIWAAGRVNVPELTIIKKQFATKYGEKFVAAAMNDTGGVIDKRLVHKLSVQPPNEFLVQAYLEKIAEEFEVDWKPAHKLDIDDVSKAMSESDGYSSVQVF